jgi:lipopolysaccharide transport system ATP-binding protein
MKPIIKVENISKEYIIGGAKEPYSTLRESLTNIARLPLKAIESRKKESKNNSFWALKDINFEVMPGEVVGIIGRNGAGKSTLLKILSRITEPTKGRIELYGRVGALLEVGTGFHPELTGRENIYLNGAILGMRREEIAKKFDEIVDFAEIEKFLDTPVKRYSSGMYTRLAFSVAAHLEPEVLIVDEVLAVGDSKFQKKCFSKLNQIGNEGKTVLIVSHDLKVVSSLCSKGYLIHEGNLIKGGKLHEVIQHYNELNSGQSGAIYKVSTPKIFWEGLENEESLVNLSHTDDLKLIFNFRTGDYDLSNFHIDLALYNEKDIAVMHIKSKFDSAGFTVEKSKNFLMECLIKSPNLSPGNYYLEIYVSLSEEVILWANQIKCCHITSTNNLAEGGILDNLFGVTVPEFQMKFLDN